MKLVEQGVLLAVKVVPNSSRTALAGWLGDALKVKVTQPAEGGKANGAVVELLAESLDIPVARVAIVSGATRARKVVRIAGFTAGELRERFGKVAR